MQTWVLRMGTQQESIVVIFGRIRGDCNDITPEIPHNVLNEFKKVLKIHTFRKRYPILTACSLEQLKRGGVIRRYYRLLSVK